MSGRKTVVLIGLVVCLGGGYVFTDWYTVIAGSSQPTYVGRESCIDCHRQQADLFHGSHHDLAMDLATPQTVLANFDNQSLAAFGVESRFFRDGDQYMVHTEGPDGAMSDFRVKYVFGVEPLQQYMVEFDRPAGMPENEISRLQVLSLCWDTEKKKWFHLQPPDVKEKIEPDDPLHWTGRTQCWNTSCADCHSTNLQKNFDLEKLVYHTTFSEIDVSCEACHGPGSHHVELAESWSLFWDRKQGYALARLKGEDPTTQIETCAKCHSRRGGIKEGFCGGESFHDFYTNELLNEQTYHDDGQIKDEVYVYGSFLQSKMYHEGIRCTDCHDPHSTKVKYDTNQLCTSCHAHPAGKYDTASHHRHKEGSTGTRCVECHMPETTYMAVDPRRDHSLRIPRPDLSVKHGTPNACTQCHIDLDKLPQPEQELLEGKQFLDWLTLAKSNEVVAGEISRLDAWAQENVLKWYGPEKQTAHYAEAFHQIRQEGSNQKAYERLRQMLSDRKTAAIVRGTAAVELGRNNEALQRVVNRAFLGSEKEMMSPVLKQLQQEQSPIVIQGLLQTLELEITSILNATWKYQAFDRQGRPVFDGVVGPLTNYVQTLMDLHYHPRRMVRIEASRVFLRVPSAVHDRLLDSKQLARHDEVFQELIESVESNQERGSALLALGSIYQLKADVMIGQRGTADPVRLMKSDQYFELARQAYRNAIRVAPNESGARGNLAAMHDQLLEQLDAEQRQIDPKRDSAKLMKLLQKIETIQEQAASLRKAELKVLGEEAKRAIASNVGAGVIDRYAMALYVDGQVAECAKQLRKAVELAPDDPMIVLHFTLILEKQEKFTQALDYANRLLKLVPKDPSYRLMRDNLQKKVSQ
ncbi:MAG: cytochrome c3 family protein [Planctomycetota bacterium]|nr:cytochrome c3 family protein [Planctomycetota bacterium]